MIGNSFFEVDDNQAAAVSPLQPHSFRIKSDQVSVVLVLYIKPIWFLENSRSAEFTLRFGSSNVTKTPAINKVLRQLTSLLYNSHDVANVDTLLFDLCSLCYHQTWQSVDAAVILQTNLHDPVISEFVARFVLCRNVFPQKLRWKKSHALWVCHGLTFLSCLRSNLASHQMYT